MVNINSQLDITQVDNPLGTNDDPWADFRQVERLTLELTQRYNYSLGKYSRFFIELQNKRFMATKCAGCEKVYTPPRPLCPDCLRVTEWVELSGEGTVKTYSVLHFSPGSNADVMALETPYTLVYVLLDGASTLFPHVLKAGEVTIGMRVRVAYAEQDVQHPIHLMHFVPLDT